MLLSCSQTGIRELFNSTIILVYASDSVNAYIGFIP